DTPPGVVRQADGSFLADARAALDDVTAIVGPEFDVGEVAREVDTLAGYIATRIGRLPVRGELVPGPGPFELEVLDADPRRVKKLRIYRGQGLKGGGREPRNPASTPAPAGTPASAPVPANMPPPAPSPANAPPSAAAPSTPPANPPAPASAPPLPLTSD